MKQWQFYTCSGNWLKGKERTETVWFLSFSGYSLPWNFPEPHTLMMGCSRIIPSPIKSVPLCADQSS